MKSLILTLSFMLLAFGGNAQDSSDCKIYPVQFSFIPPLSTNGSMNVSSVNQISFNLIAGYAGGLEGFELGGFANILKGGMTGTQIAGFSNVVGGSTQGIQIAGFANVNQKRTEGVQIAGFSNVVSDSTMALQLAGFSNMVTGTAEGGQLAGFLNLNRKNFTGFQAAGFANISGSKTTGSQLAGYYNMSVDTCTGAQISGFMNLAPKYMKGAQVSGFMNVAGTLAGSQIGFINIADSLESGTPFGFLSFIRKGGMLALELGGDETFYGNLSLKTGSQAFYNIISVSARTGPDFYWGLGYGVGSMLKPYGKLRISLDLTASQINRSDIWSNYLNLLSRAKLGFSWQATEHFAIMAGPSFNVLTVSKFNQENLLDLKNVSPYNIYDKQYQQTRVTMWPGAHLSVRF
ncbi:MAG: hypothetical protein KDC13_09815 [Bacteroidetes bacterium]|nr:hypothetical protein [Bacteroidota bacterium]